MLPLVSHGEYADGTDIRTDGRTPDTITLSAMRPVYFIDAPLLLPTSSSRFLQHSACSAITQVESLVGAKQFTTSSSKTIQSTRRAHGTPSMTTENRYFQHDYCKRCRWRM